MTIRRWWMSSGGRLEVRASPEDPHTGERLGFGSLDDLVTYLRMLTGDGSRGPDKTKGGEAPPSHREQLELVAVPISSPMENTRMKRLLLLMVLVAAIVSPSASKRALAQTPAPVAHFLSRTAGLPLSGPYDVAHFLYEFEPGAATPWHTHPGLVLVTVMEGEVTFSMGGTDKAYKVGEHFVEIPNEVGQASNRQATRSSVLATFILPKDAPLSTPQTGDTTPAPRPVAKYLTRTAGLPQSGPYEVAHFILEFEAGAATPWHTHPGLVLVTVIEGEVTFTTPEGEKAYKVGDNFVELPDQLGQASNRTAARTRVLASFVLPPAAPLSTPHPAPTMPLPDTDVEGAPLMFPETGYSLDGEFLDYWRTNGDLAVFGMPIASARQGSNAVSQWLERARFELHANQPAPYKVLLGRLGAEVLEQQGRPWQGLPKADPRAAHYFAETGHAIAPEFWDYWRSHGLQAAGLSSTQRSLALFGYPLSEAQMERNSSGDLVLTQWFERARFEYHPSNPPSSRVVLGRLGAELAFTPAHMAMLSWTVAQPGGSDFRFICG